jgi:hypothetical protein
MAEPFMAPTRQRIPDWNFGYRAVRFHLAKRNRLCSCCIVSQMTDLTAAQMPNERYRELVELARMCWRQAQEARLAQDVAHELRKMAREYQEKAAKLNDGKLPELDGRKGD